MILKIQSKRKYLGKYSIWAQFHSVLFINFHIELSINTLHFFYYYCHYYYYNYFYYSVVLAYYWAHKTA